MTAVTAARTPDSFVFPDGLDAETQARLERAHQTECGRVHVFSSQYRIDAPYVWTPQFSWCNTVAMSSTRDGVETMHHMIVQEWLAIQPAPLRLPPRDSIDPDEFRGDDREHAELLFRGSDPDTKHTLLGRNPGMWRQDDEE
jgi:hypothetical protein